MSEFKRIKLKSLKSNAILCQRQPIKSILEQNPEDFTPLERN
jgi:hypothetical protein